MGFLFPCYRELKQKLGEFDAFCECIELATRDLISRANAAPDRDAYVGELSQRHGICVNRLHVEALSSHVARMHILAVHQCLEAFLINLRAEHPQGKEWDMDVEADRLTKTARAIGFKHDLAFDICQYYRDIRNATVHRSAQDKVGRDGLRLQDLLDRVSHDAALRILHAPNFYVAVTFDDFLLFTRSAKILAEELCAAARPTDEILAEIAKAATVERQGRLRKAPARLANAQSGFLQTTYSLSKQEADSIVTGLLA